MKILTSLPFVTALGVVLVFGASGCGKSTQATTVAATPPLPKTAATQLQQAFTDANPEAKNTAKVASEALVAANYEQAVQSLQAIKARENLTLQQGTAVYNSEMALEARLIAGIQAGDPNAQRAYNLLKQSKRN